MNFSEEFSKLDTPNREESLHLIQWWRQRLNHATGEPDLLHELIDYQLHKQSKPALKVLLSLKELYAQDFFTIINDYLHHSSTVLPALRLLSHMLTAQTSWLYKMVQSIVFPTLLKLLRPTVDIVIVTSTVYVLCGLIPLSPYHVTPHLPDIFESFTQLASLTTDTLSQELLLVIRVSVYYLFLQLYALFPCSFLQYLKGRFGPMGEVHIYQEHIAPLFQYVQLHPNLIVELPSQETQRTKWSSRDPNEIATLSLSLCVDPNLVPKETHKLLHTADSSPLLSTLPLSLPVDHKYCGPLTSSQLSQVHSCSPSLRLGCMDTPIYHTPSKTTPTSRSESVSLDSSMQTTPTIHKTRRRSPLFNYSPTASVEAVQPTSDPPTPSTHITLIKKDSHTPNSSPRSLSERINGLFRRKTTPNLNNSNNNFSNTRTEDFATISVSEYSALPTCNIQRSSSASYMPHPLSYSHTPSPPVEGEESNDKPHPPHNVEETMLLASQKLQKFVDELQQNELSESETPPIISDLSHNLSPCDSDNSPLFLMKSVLREKQDIKSHNVTSPLVALDVFIKSGRVLHSGSHDLKSHDRIPLADLEGINWDYFGCCPHTEELTLMSHLVKVLHSQVLYERYQCILHSKRNRRLMTKTRNVGKLENEIVALRHQLHQQDELIQCLRRENQEERERHPPDRSLEIKQLQTDKQKLHDDIERLHKEISQLEIRNRNLSQELSDSRRVVFTLDNTVDHMKRKLNQGVDLKSELQALTNEHLLLEELYHQQKLTLSTLRRENTQGESSKAMSESLLKDKEAAISAQEALRKEVAKMSVLLKEREGVIQQREVQIVALKKSLCELQEKHTEKIKSLETKYHAIKAINRDLEETLLINKTSKTSYHRSRQHKRTDSSRSLTPGQTPPLGPSPSLLITNN